MKIENWKLIVHQLLSVHSKSIYPSIHNQLNECFSGNQLYLKCLLLVGLATGCYCDLLFFTLIILSMISCYLVKGICFQNIKIKGGIKQLPPPPHPLNQEFLYILNPKVYSDWNADIRMKNKLVTFLQRTKNTSQIYIFFS